MGKSSGLADRRPGSSPHQRHPKATCEHVAASVPRLQGRLGHLQDSVQFRELQDLGTKEPRADSAKGFTVTCGYSSLRGVGISCHLDAGMQRFDYFGVCFHWH